MRTALDETSFRIVYRYVVVSPKVWACCKFSGRSHAPKTVFLRKKHRRTILKGSGCLLDMFHFIGLQNFFQWGHPKQAAFVRIKKVIATASVLAYHDMKRPAVVSADASSYKLGACSLQQHGDRLRSVAFASRSPVARRCHSNVLARQHSKADSYAVHTRPLTLGHISITHTKACYLMLKG